MKNTYNFISIKVSTKSCLVDLLNNFLRCLAFKSIAEPCWIYFADRSTTQNSCDPLPPWLGRWKRGGKNNLHPWWRETSGASGQNLRIRDAFPSLLQDIEQGPPIAGDGWRGRRLPASLTKQLFKKIAFSACEDLKDRIVLERIGGETLISEIRPGQSGWVFVSLDWD